MYQSTFTRIRAALATVLLAVAVVGFQPAHAADLNAGHAPSAAAMGVDVLVIRPLSLVATVAGTGLFVLSLPFSALGRNTDEAAGQLVGAPAKYTFLRPLGDFGGPAALR